MTISLKDARKRIKSTRNTWKMTKAMEMVSAAKLKKIQLQLYHFRDYFSKFEEMKDIVLQDMEIVHPLVVLQDKDQSKSNTGVIIMSSDRGLCGAYNSNLLKKVSYFLDENKNKWHNLKFYIFGKKALNFMSKRVPLENISAYPSNLKFMDIKLFVEKIIKDVTDGKIDRVFIIYTNFITTARHLSTVEKVIPIMEERKIAKSNSHFIFEPKREKMANTVINDYLTYKIYERYLSSQASEFAARMIAMQQASQNALDMIDTLTLLFNKARQAQITKEILEVVSGAEALK